MASRRGHGRPTRPARWRTCRPKRSSKTDSGFSRYGGLLARKTKATGFFHAARVDGRWWLVDPDGCLFLHKAVTGVRPLTTKESRAACNEKFGSETNWASQHA